MSYGEVRLSAYLGLGRGGLGGGPAGLPPLPTGIPFPRLVLTVTISMQASTFCETHSRRCLSSPKPYKGKESMPDVNNPVANSTPCCYSAFTIDDKVES